MKNLVFVDVEAAGPTPMSGTMTEFGAVLMNGESYHGKIYDGFPDPENPAKPIVGRLLRSVPDVADEFHNWLRQHVKGRLIFVSDNPAYDWQWIAAMFDFCGIDNPFGHSARRIGDFYAGLQRDFTKTQDWKRLRRTPHTHNPVDDARGNMEALTTLLEQLEADLRS
jgi:hypothetical protein